MTLRVVLKPGEQVSLNGAIFEVAEKTVILLHNRAALLRCRELMTESEASTPAKRLYFDVMTIALADTGAELDIAPAVRSAERLCRAPSTPRMRALVEEMLRLLAAGHSYKALMRAKKLIKLEAAAAGARVAESHASAPVAG